MKLKRLKLAPVLIACGVIFVVCLLRLAGLDIVERLERMTYDQRVRTALHFPQPVSTNLAAVFLSDDSLRALNNGSLGFRYSINWPRHIYGRVLREAATEGASAVAFDVLFDLAANLDHASVPVVGERRLEAIAFLKSLRPAEEPATMIDGGEEVTYIDSDDYFAWQLHRADRAVLAADEGVLPLRLFATNAMALGDISSEADPDGVLRRVKAFRTYRQWHRLFKQASKDYTIDLKHARVESGKIVLQPAIGDPITIAVDADNTFDVTDFVNPLPPGLQPREKAFTEERVWHMGIVLAARQMGLDLESALVEPEQGRIILRSPTGLQRILPVDRDGYFFVNWELTPFDSRLTRLPIEEVLKRDLTRPGQTIEMPSELRDKLVVIGSTAQGNNMTDRGATPLEKSTFLVSKHWNVANSILTGRFVDRASLGTEIFFIVLLGVLTAFVTWQFRIWSAAGGVLLMVALYIVASYLLFIQQRYWMPIVLPAVGAMLMQYACLISYRAVFEQAEQRRVKSFFSKVVSPNIVNVLLDQEKLSLGGTLGEVTVFFADVRGFTELTDLNQEKAEAYVRDHKLSEAEANAHRDENARDTLGTINFYLGLVSDTVKKHDGTLDKYIGDCVMAFWGAPTPNAKHALAAVQAAIDAQRAIHEVNQRRKAESEKIEIENRARASAGLAPKPLQPTLSLGSGINTGMVTVGMMGSEANIINYTVFGREVNLASRLEGVSGHGRIVIGETTYQHLLRDAPELAARCIELETTKPKGFKNPVRNYEVPWRPAEAIKANPDASSSKP